MGSEKSTRYWGGGGLHIHDANTNNDIARIFKNWQEK